MKRTRLLVASLIGLVIALGASPANAAVQGDQDLDPLVVAMLAEVPGGIVIDATHAVWPDLGMELAVSTSRGLSARAVQNCATGRICAYSSPSLGGSVLTFTTCTVSAIPSTFSTKSVANARSSGYVQVRNGSTVLATINAGGWGNISGTATNLRCLL